MKEITERLIVNDYVKRNLTVQEIAKYRRVQRIRVSKVLKDRDILLTVPEKKKLREGFDLSSLPFELREHSYYYVYGLYDSRTGELFYIGKGKAERCRDHFYDCKNKAKKERIQEITSKGGNVIVKFFQKGLTEEQSLKIEMELIQSNEGLLNILRK